MLDTLTRDEQYFVDELLFADKFGVAFKFVRANTHGSINDVLEAVYKRQTTLGIDFNGSALARVAAFASLDKIMEPICVIEASWDGDSFGWFICLTVITKQPSQFHPKYTQHGLCLVRGLDAQVERAIALGEELAEVANTTFYLTSVEVDDGKRWWDTQQDTMH